MRLDTYRQGDYTPGRSLAVQIAWYFVGSPLVEARWLPLARVKAAILRAFGAKIGRGSCIKPGVRVKFPWRLTVGDYCWIGEDAWIDNLAPVVVGDHCCISQGAYLCTGSHDWSRDSFDLIHRPITLKEGVWIGARASVAPGVTAGERSILALGSVAVRDLVAGMIHQGNPAVAVKSRPAPSSDAGAVKNPETTS